MKQYAIIMGKLKPLSYREAYPFTRQDVRILRDHQKRKEKIEEDERKFMSRVLTSFSEPGFTKRFNINTASPKPVENKKETTLSEIYAESVLESIRRDNKLLSNHHFYSSDNHILSISGYIEDKDNVLNRLPGIIKDTSSRAYKNLLEKSKSITSTQLLTLQNMVNRYASKNSKEIFRCEEIHLNKKTIKQLIDYYKMDSVAGDFLLSFHKRNENTLAELINQTYDNLMKDKTWRN